MPNPFALMPQVVDQPRPQVYYAQVSAHQPAPASFSDPLFVVIPQWHPDYFHRIDWWPACNGNTLPAPGADCLVAYDDKGILWCIAWKGTHS